MEIHNNYRPIPNSPVMCKLLKCALAAQLKVHRASSPQTDEMQSGFRTNHSSGTTLTGLLDVTDCGLLMIHVLLDLLLLI